MEQKKTVVAADVAEDEFARWASALDLDVDPAGMNEEDRSTFAEQKRLIVNAIQAGRLTISGECLAVFKPRDGYEAITFQEPKASVVINAKAPDAAARVAVMVQKMTGEPLARFEGMLVRDYKVCTAIATLLLAAR